MGRFPTRTRTWLAAALLAPALVLSPLGAGTAAAQDMQIYLSLTEADGTPVTDLQPEDIAILEDGEERETVRLEPIDWPMKLDILIDNASVLAPTLPQLRQGLEGLINALPDDLEVALYTISPNPRTLVARTTDHAALIEGLGRIAPESNQGSRFVEAILEAVDRFDDDDGDYFPVVLAVAADGIESSQFNENDIEELQKKIGENGITFHMMMQSLGVESAGLGTQTQLGLGLTKLTTGRYENVTASAAGQLAKLLPEFGNMLARSHIRQSNSYRVTYRRPRGAPNPTQGIGLNTSRPGLNGSMSFDGRVPQG